MVIKKNVGKDAKTIVYPNARHPRHIKKYACDDGHSGFAM